MKKKFNKVAVGGTFDELHRGHKTLLLKAFEIGEKILIGLCSDEFVEQMGKPHITANFVERLKELLYFLKSNNFEDKGFSFLRKYSALFLRREVI